MSARSVTTPRRAAAGIVVAAALAATIAAVPAGSAHAQEGLEGPKPSICIIPFKAPRGAAGGVSLLSTRVEAALVRLGAFTVVERVRLESILTEQELSESGSIDPTRAVKAGKMIGARYLVTANMSIWDQSVDHKQVPKTTTWLDTPRAHMVGDMKVVDAETGEIVLAEKIEVNKTFKVRGQRGADGLTSDEANDFHEDCERAIVGKLLAKLAPIRAMVKSDRVILNRGSNARMAAGQVFDVFASGAAFQDPKSGETLGRDEIKIAKVKVTRAADRYSDAEVVEGLVTLIPAENICRLTDNKPVADLASMGPIIEILLPADGSTAKTKSVQVSVRTLGGAGKVEVTVNGQRAAGQKGLMVATVELGQGFTPIIAAATDENGKTSEARIRVLFDDAGPEITFLDPAPGSVVGGHRVRAVVQVQDAGGVDRVEILGVDATPQGGGRYAVDVILAEGTNRIVAKATDRSGNEAQQTLEVERDSTSPAVTITGPQDGSRIAGEVKVTARVPGSDIAKVTIGGEPATAGKDGVWEATLRLPPGDHWIVAEAQDRAGNQGAARIRIAVDDKGPSLEVATQVKVAGKVASSKTIVTVNGRTVEVKADGSFEVVIDLPPDKLVRVLATDEYGNTRERVIDYGK